MYNITLPILGTRLKQIREHIGYSQAQLAEQLNCKQNAISNLELGKGGSLKLLFQVLNFYSNYVFIDLIFSEKFYLISNTEEDELEIDTEETYEEEKEPEEFKVLDHVNWDMQNETEEVDTTSETPTLDDLTR